MKRTAATIMLLAGVGGCVSPDGQNKLKTKPFGAISKGVEVPGLVTPDGAPVMATMPAATTEVRTAAGKKTSMKAKGEVVQTSANSTVEDPTVQQAAGFSRIRGNDCDTCGIHTPGLMSRIGGHFQGDHEKLPGDPYAYGPSGNGLGTLMGRNGIMPVPGMGPPGAVAAVGAIGAGGAMGPVASNMRTSIKFASPQGMRVTWLGPNGYIEPGLVAPAPYNFMQGNVYRLKVTGVQRQPGKVYYPTLDLAPATLKTITFLSHNTVPIAFTDDDFERVNSGSMVIKVIYLPDPAFQDAAAIAGAEELVSTNLAPGVDPIVEASSRGTILAVIRMGNIDLENPFSPAMDAPPGGMGRPVMMAPTTATTMSTPAMTPPGAMRVPSTPAMPAPGTASISGGMPIAPPALPQINASPTSNSK